MLQLECSEFIAVMKTSPKMMFVVENGDDIFDIVFLILQLKNEK